MHRRCLPAVIIIALFAGLNSAAYAIDIIEEALTFVTHDGLEIGCIVSYPDQSAGRFPALLLIAGSGLHDADVTLDEPTLAITRGRQTLFKPLARFFSRSGWTVLRCNKRGASFRHRDDQPDLLQAATFEDLVEDAHAAMRTLHGHPRALASPLVVLGHSEGAAIATRVALRAPEIDLVVLLGSMARSTRSLLEYQLVDRNLHFLRRAADADGDGVLTLEEMNGLDGNFGLSSVYVYNSAEILFDVTPSELGRASVDSFNSTVDVNGDGQLQIDDEIEPRMRREANRFLALATDGSLGRHWQSSIQTEALVSFIHQVDVPILFVHGELDAQTPLDEALTLMAKLEAAGRDSYELLVFPAAGHSLSKPNDTYSGDGGLSLLDNLTLNAPPPGVRRRLLQRIEAILAQ